jgi:cell surface protein SprA
VNFSLSNNQISEMSSDEMAVGLGYRFDAVRLFINQRTYESDVNVRGDLSIRDNINRIRTLAANPEDENSEQNTAGQKVVSVKFNADYVLNDRFNMRFFFDRVVNKPKVTSSFPTANTNVGFSITFTLTQ